MTDQIVTKPPLLPELAALLARVAAEDGPLQDPTLMEAAAGRAQADRTTERWNEDLPLLARDETVYVEADAALGSALCRMRVFVPEGARNGAILFVHGGGFAFGSPESHERCARLLAVESGLPVLSPEYRLAPEHPYPAGLNDTVAAMRGAFAATTGLGVTEGPLLLAGDSAGANLALAAMLKAQADGYPKIAGGLMLYGTFDTDFETPSYRLFDDGPGLTRPKMQRYWAWYAGGKDLSNDPLACPLKASDEALTALPPLHLMAAEIDPLCSDSVHFAERLKALGRPETLSIVTGVTHGFLQNTLHLEAAREALARAAAQARLIAAKT